MWAARVFQHTVNPGNTQLTGETHLIPINPIIKGLFLPTREAHASLKKVKL